MSPIMTFVWLRRCEANRATLAVQYELRNV
jgi:hypothetical protein